MISIKLIFKTIINLLAKAIKWNAPVLARRAFTNEMPGPGPRRSRFTGIAKSRRAARQRKAAK